jgi:hypothetical protein
VIFRTATRSSRVRSSAGSAEAVGGNLPIYIRKEQELHDVERRYPARRYVLVDDKRRILAAVKEQGRAGDDGVRPPGALRADPSAESYPCADVTVERRRGRRRESSPFSGRQLRRPRRGGLRAGGRYATFFFAALSMSAG